MSVTIPTEILSRFEPSADGLLDHLRKQVDDEMLQEIAESDAGDYNDGPQFAALKQLRDSGVIPVPMKWEPMEALQLTTYGEPGAFGDPSEEEFRREHLARAFACAAMLRAEVEPENHFLGREGGVASLVSSALFLGVQVEQQCGAFLLWRIDQFKWYEKRPLFALALVLLCVLSRRVNDANVIVLCDWVLEEKAAERSCHEARCRNLNWERGLSFHGMRRSPLVWRVLSAQLKEHAACCAEQRVRERLTEIADLIV